MKMGFSGTPVYQTQGDNSLSKRVLRILERDALRRDNSKYLQRQLDCLKLLSKIGGDEQTKILCQSFAPGAGHDADERELDEA